ncbi:ABC transporter ATP-binding protein [Acidianus sp. RZ1]|uniref:ABC transporter ATP-binding protein n=1 Tax=Acidianus sp. RZ1 TaxID=1540082 RepID=UPI00149324DD|nr:ABC transporter ATP-binding protein [Acidianus sp. RZ1]NON62383.1 ABC transporter ATP-binding protein [Acidianus sp. RZ1]
MIEVSHVYKSYGKVLANEDISFNLEKGLLAIIGPNGAGKTTLIMQIIGNLTPDRGEILIDNYKPGERKAKELLGVIPQNSIPISNLSAKDHVNMFAKLRGIKLNKHDINEILKVLEIDPNKSTNEMSGGERRKVLLASVLALRSKYLILDEPTVGLDLESRNHIHNVLKSMKAERGIILTTHYLEEAEKLADNFLLMKRKVLLYGNKEEVYREIFGRKIYIVTIGGKKEIVPKEKIEEVIRKYKDEDVEIRMPNLEEIYYEIFRDEKKAN